MEDTEAGTGPPLYDSLVDTFDDFDGYDHIAMMDEDDLDDLEAIRLIFSQNKKKRGLKFRYRRCDWESHIQTLTATTNGSLVADVESRMLQRPRSNRQRSG